MSTRRLILDRPRPSRPRANNPAGRRSRTRITSANSAEGRKTVLSVGSAPLMTPLANPIAKPPSVAVQSRSIPPTTTPTRTTIVSLSANSGLDERELDGQDHRDRRREHAREQDGDADHRVRADAEQPRGAEVRRGGAHVQADPRPPEQQREQPERHRGDDDGEDRHLAGRRRRRSTPPGSATRARQQARRACRRGCRGSARALEQERDRERRHEHHRRRRGPERPEDGDAPSGARARSRRRSRRAMLAATGQSEVKASV